MPIKSEFRPAFERLRKQHGIIFTDALSPEEWPDNHRGIFEAIEKLRQFKYSTYATAEESEDTFDSKSKAKEHARKLSEKTKDCVSRNEATWRFACEPLVFSRLTSEIACKTCRKRVWRSEVEAKLEGDGRAAAKLKKRQENREPCRCPRNTRPNDEDERVGLNRLFIDRAEDKVVHPPDLAKQLPQEQRPDRVYGIRQTRNFEDLMFKEIGSGEFLGERLQQQPHPTVQGEALLFPFLVVEAKAGNAADDWSSICLQTAFPIYTYLNVQQSLRAATSQGSASTASPLVWFFMSRGEDWRLSLAYTKARTGQPFLGNPHHTTEIVHVWNGCITSRDDALQLFLIVDYMSDWARDVYRPALLTGLRCLASGDPDVATVFTDTDIYSSRDLIPSHAIKTSESGHHEMQTAFRNLDSNLGTVRHVTPIETGFLSLFITTDNIQTFLLSMNPKIREHFVRRVLYQFHSTQTPCLLSSDQLNTLEEAWTGLLRPRVAFNLQGIKFYTVHLISYHLSASWEQVRELFVIAIAEDAFEILIAESKLRIKRRKASKPDVVIDGDTFESDNSLNDRILELRSAAADQNLLASISRTAGYIDASRNAIWPYFKADDPFIWELVEYTYKFHKRGELEPELPFLRISKLYETQENIRNSNNTKEPDILRGASHISEDTTYSNEFTRSSSDKSMKRWEFLCQADFSQPDSCTKHGHPIPPIVGDLQVSGAGAVLVYRSRTTYVPQPDLCVYIVHGPLDLPSTDSLAKIVKETYEDRDVYRTFRRVEPLNLRAHRTYRHLWNRRKTYGVLLSSASHSFVMWIESLDRRPLTLQRTTGNIDTLTSIDIDDASAIKETDESFIAPAGEGSVTKKRKRSVEVDSDT